MTGKTSPDFTRDLIEKVEAGSGPLDITEAMAIANDLSPWSPGEPEWDLLVRALRDMHLCAEWLANYGHHVWAGVVSEAVCLLDPRTPDNALQRIQNTGGGDVS
ncbi:hypothetical protein [Methyloceanibacter caenitepidi]|uniref:Uncharacterized protein n=1 Tax=Methyloceanibacter caenitepidi TaxID=1384459 RepID=A0A0A8JZ44_9HYPH|nr:hypothetical protein [Methyloceanibacter caenitepidi]BAQ16078.1 hypothetical protein GL4_0615 [Methyloceanibacter caenitepidi]